MFILSVSFWFIFSSANQPTFSSAAAVNLGSAYGLCYSYLRCLARPLFSPVLQVALYKGVYSFNFLQPSKVKIAVSFWNVDL